LEALLEFTQGPLFRLTFAIMLLGLARILFLDLVGMYEAYRKAGDKCIPWKLTIGRTLMWFFPVKRIFNHRPLYSILAMLFHVGLIIVPLFLFAHVQLWKSGLGFGWFSIPRGWADVLTLTTIACGLAIFIGRVGVSKSRSISRKQDYLWPLLLIVPFVTGFICAHSALNPRAYQAWMLIHVLAGEFIFVALPFTKIAHCVLQPLSQLVSVLAWKFPASVDDDVCTTLNKKGAPV
jgi:nitrate reductase gamma subunit